MAAARRCGSRRAAASFVLVGVQGTGSGRGADALDIRQRRTYWHMHPCQHAVVPGRPSVRWRRGGRSVPNSGLQKVGNGRETSVSYARPNLVACGAEEHRRTSGSTRGTRKGSCARRSVAQDAMLGRQFGAREKRAKLQGRAGATFFRYDKTGRRHMQAAPGRPPGGALKLSNTDR
jgi:hypothetical protein